MERGTTLEWNKVFKEIILGKDKSKLQGSNLGEDDTKACSNTKQMLSVSEDKPKLCLTPPKDMSNTLKCDRSVRNPYKLNENPTHLDQTALLNKKPSSLRGNKGREAPAWDHAFKDILEDNFSNKPCCENECIPAPVPFKPVKSRTVYPKKKTPPSSKSKKNKEIEEQVKELFESWKALKEPEPEYSLNDFEGAGINIFKYPSDQKDKFYLPKQDPPKPPTPKKDIVSDPKQPVSREFQKRFTGPNSAIRSGWRNSFCQKDSGYISKPLQPKNRYMSRENQTKDSASSPLKGFDALKPYDKESEPYDKEREECWDDELK